MHGVLGTIGSENCAERTRRLILCLLSVSWSNKFSPSLNGSIFDEFHSHADIARDKALQVREKWLSDVLAIENIRGLLRKFGHFKLINLESLLLNCVNNLSKVLVTAWLNHGEG